MSIDQEFGQALDELQATAAHVDKCHRDWADHPDDDDLRVAFEHAWRAYEVAHHRCLTLPPIRGREPLR
jgi:hypothetical protein